MSTYRLVEDLYIAPTPAGAYFAIAGTQDDAARRLLFALLRADATPELDAASLCAWTGCEAAQDAAEILYRAQSVGWVRGDETSTRAPAANMEQDIPKLLAAVATSGKALLADDNGFYLARAGLAHETAEELSALSADIAALHERHRGLICNNLGCASSAWAVVDAAGNSQVGVWPLYVGAHRLALVTTGEPCFHTDEFLSLVWALARRYA